MPYDKRISLVLIFPCKHNHKIHLVGPSYILAYQVSPGNISHFTSKYFVSFRYIKVPSMHIIVVCTKGLLIFPHNNDLPHHPRCLARHLYNKYIFSFNVVVMHLGDPLFPFVESNTKATYI